MSVLDPKTARFAAHVPVLIVGGGACGMVAALAAREKTSPVLVLERDPAPAGSTAMSSGMIPAAGTRAQAARGVVDTPSIMEADIQRKNHGEADPAIVRQLAEVSGPTIDWLSEDKGVALTLVEGFRYPGHSRLRMHAMPSRTGAELIGSLTRAVAHFDVDVLCEAMATDLFADADGRVYGLRYRRPDGACEEISCDALVLACNGFGGNAEMVKQYIPAMADAEYFGHPGNTGDAVQWGVALGADIRDMGAYQGHGSLAWPERTLITWALMMEGGIQVNSLGERFSNEHQGYSEQALAVLAQPGRIAWDIFDDRLLALGRTFEDFRVAEKAGALKRGGAIEELAAAIEAPAAALAKTLDHVRSCADGTEADPFGRDFSEHKPLMPPYYAIRVTGALFHTQGGLAVDPDARVLRPNGRPLPNLFAAGGAARGVSGASVAGYLSGNGLLSAVVLGRIAGQSAGRLAGGDSSSG